MDHEPAAEKVRLAAPETFDAPSPPYQRPRWPLDRWFEKAGFGAIENHSTKSGLNYASSVKAA